VCYARYVNSISGEFDLSNIVIFETGAIKTKETWKKISASRDIQLVEFQLEIHTFSLLSLTKALFTLTNAFA